MHFLKLHTPDIHVLLGRLLDRIRLADLPIAGIEAGPQGEGYAVAVRMATANHRAVERLAHQMRHVIGTSVVEIGCDCAASSDAHYVPLQPSSTAG